VLLLIGAGSADAASFNGIAAHLADQYTVVSYDRRGYSRSPLDDPEEEQRIETHSDDAHRLLAQLCTEPAYVFGSSGGALIGLDLAIRHPEQVRTLASHEPPAGGLLPDAERPRLPLRDPQKFAASIGVSFNDASQTPNCRTNRPRRKLGSLLTECSAVAVRTGATARRMLWGDST